MIEVTFHDSVGRPVQTASLRGVTEANENAVALGLFWVPGTADLAHDMIDAIEGTILPRPMLPAIPPSGVAPLVIDLSVYPAGAVVSARNQEGDVIEIIDLTDPLTLIDAGIYSIIVSPPWPWLAEAWNVEVTNA